MWILQLEQVLETWGKQAVDLTNSSRVMRHRDNSYLRSHLRNLPWFSSSIKLGYQVLINSINSVQKWIGQPHISFSLPIRRSSNILNVQLQLHNSHINSCTSLLQILEVMVFKLKKHALMGKFLKRPPHLLRLLLSQIFQIRESLLLPINIRIKKAGLIVASKKILISKNLPLIKLLKLKLGTLIGMGREASFAQTSQRLLVMIKPQP